MDSDLLRSNPPENNLRICSAIAKTGHFYFALTRLLKDLHSFLNRGKWLSASAKKVIELNEFKTVIKDLKGQI